MVAGVTRHNIYDGPMLRWSDQLQLTVENEQIQFRAACPRLRDGPMQGLPYYTVLYYRESLLCNTVL